MTMTNKKTALLDAIEYGVDARYNSQEDKQKVGLALMQARRMRMSNLSKQDLLRAKLMQLKLQMDEYLSSSGDRRNISSLRFYIPISIQSMINNKILR
ncbi:hypothetical protein [Sphingobacterium kitahiroshimense]|uniref:Uncharacterized protein n=1 Tax=Sphingobacterium kitahiroshimense TaxID=470446 RepID=A0ABV0C147_9SPHI